MDLYKAIHSLYEEKKRLDRLIESLERLEATAASLTPKQQTRRGRRKMNSRERREVSERMKRYWEARRGQGVSAPGGLAPPIPATPIS